MQDTNKETKVREYITNYLFELQRHFDISDRKMRYILRKVYRDSGSLHKFGYFIKKYISMVKSFYINKLRRIK